MGTNNKVPNQQGFKARVTNLFAIAGHFVSYRWVSGPHNFLVILWNLLKTKKIVHQQKQTTNESNNCWSRLNASRAARNSFVDRMRPVGRVFVTPALKQRLSILSNSFCTRVFVRLSNLFWNLVTVLSSQSKSGSYLPVSHQVTRICSRHHSASKLKNALHIQYRRSRYQSEITWKTFISKWCWNLCLWSTEVSIGIYCNSVAR